MEEKLKELLGDKLGEMFFKIALQLEKVDKLEKEIEELKKVISNTTFLEQVQNSQSAIGDKPLDV